MVVDDEEEKIPEERKGSKHESMVEDSIDTVSIEKKGKGSTGKKLINPLDIRRKSASADAGSHDSKNTIQW